MALMVYFFDTNPFQMRNYQPVILQNTATISCVPNYPSFSAFLTVRLKCFFLF